MLIGQLKKTLYLTFKTVCLQLSGLRNGLNNFISLSSNNQIKFHKMQGFLGRNFILLQILKNREMTGILEFQHNELTKVSA